MEKALQIVPSISVEPVREVEPGYLLGTLFIEGVEHHLEMLEVVEDPRPASSRFRNRTASTNGR